MASKRSEAQVAQDEGEAALSNPEAQAATGRRNSGDATPTYQVIVRHLAKFRDGARALLDAFGEQTPSPVAPPVSEKPVGPVSEPKGPLQVRIERHMGSVDRALLHIKEVNPERKKKADLSPELREAIIKREQTIRDIVSAELHFWSASIQNSPLDRFDEMERAWIARIIRLGKLLGVDADHHEHLDFLLDWASHEHF